MTQNQAKAKQHLEAEVLLFGNCSLSSSALSFKINVHIKKKCAQKQVCSFYWDHKINYDKYEKKKNLSLRSHIIRPRAIHGHKYINYKNVLVWGYLHVLSNTLVIFEA